MASRKQFRDTKQRRAYAKSHSLHRLLGSLARWLLQILFKIGRGPQWARSGFVLPTTVLLLLVVTLTVGSISLRTLNRTSETIGDRQQRVIYNAATPAIDRAKAKLEFMFDSSQDERLPNGVPGEKQLLGMMLNDGRDVGGFNVPIKRIGPGNNIDPYTFPDESQTAAQLGLPASLDVDGDGQADRLDLDGDNLPDNAWVYEADTDGNGTNDALVAYSILFETPATPSELKNQSEAALAGRAGNLEVRNGPLSAIQSDNPVCQSIANAPPIETGWFTDSASVRKNFQVNAYVLPLNENTGQPNENGTVSALEFQQDRQYNKGNKWGAWFRNDLEIAPGSEFNWNGAMHTEGSLVVGKQLFNAYLISSRESCLYDRQSSEVTVAEVLDDGNASYVGQTISGSIVENGAGSRSQFHIFNDAEPPIEGAEATVTPGEDSIADGVTTDKDYILDPVILVTEDRSAPRNYAGTFDAVRAAGWDARKLAAPEEGRIYNDGQTRPKVDDSYRADNRYGPKPVYDGQNIPAGVQIGAPIAGDQMAPLLTDSALTTNVSIDDNLGLDGYWERRARREGMRIMVGQRLELGNTFGWKGANRVDGTSDPLYPWDISADPALVCNGVADRCHEAKQRRTLRDNLAAVQAAAIYHSDGTSSDGDFPKLCLSVTSHPGTPKTIETSTTFNNLPGSVTPTPDDISFFDGHGTNGWEYPAPAANATSFASAIAPGQPLGIALRNLAKFAGDPLGGAPSFQPLQDGDVHPYPYFSMWGDFSMLRRILDSGTAYADLSVADKTYLHTAACTLGMLAGNIDTLNNFVIPDVTSLRAELSAIGSSASPEAIFSALSDQNRRLAQILHLREQVASDRKYGFATSSSIPDRRECSFGDDPTVDSLVLLCPTEPKFPALYYIFPTVANHTHTGSATNPIFPLDQPTTEEYIADAYVTAKDGGDPYTVVSLVGLQTMALAPKAQANWLLPASTGGINEIDIKGTKTSVAVLDTNIFNRRESMNARLLNLDLGLLRSNTSPSGLDFWLPRKSLVYAFREDSVREDMIVRPSTSGPCSNDTQIQSAACLMDAVTDTPQDPPLNPANSISPKPVDYYPDPDRRVHGFRLVNGAELARAGDDGHGLSFISDDPVYIQGDFNLHQNAQGTRLEEFTNLLPDNRVYNFDEFYNQRTALDTEFARYGNANGGPDLWRATEILSDAITILSNSFCDGSIQDGFVTAGASGSIAGLSDASLGYDASSAYDCQLTDHTSYLNQNKPQDFLGSGEWQRENSFDDDSPIEVTRNGQLLDNNGNPNIPLPLPNNRYWTFNQSRSLAQASTTRVNSVFISGIIPSRPFQSYGGLHNFPRLIEDWKTGGNQSRLYISGAFIQLNFSNISTGSFDQETWEPEASPALTALENKLYYDEPDRLWGYDVGLQYAPTAPISKRFANAGSFRSEFYNEPPVDDPYINNLQAALNRAPNL